ncbi:MAG: hypothetical protein ACRDKB_04845 [Actinomycetota bacterium]
MADTSLVDLETSIKKLPGVLGCVILTDKTGNPSEIQAFTRLGVDQGEVQRSILDEVATRGLPPVGHIMVFELEAESHFGDRETLERAAELAEQEARARGPARPEAKEVPAPPPDAERRHGVLRRRPLLSRVVLSSTTWRSEAEVALGSEGSEVSGFSEGEKTPHGLKVLAQATLEATGRLVEGMRFVLKGASLVKTFGREAVLVVVEVDDGPESIGAALVREGPTSEAAVRATLDAVNRRLAPG